MCKPLPIKFYANICLACAFLLSAFTYASSTDSAGVVTFTLGKAYLNGSKLIKIGSTVEQGDVIETLSNGHVHIRFKDNGLVSIRPDSKLYVEHYQYNANAPSDSVIKFSLEEGVMRSISGDGAKSARDKFRLNTPIAAIGVRGTDFVVKVSNSITQAVVNEGAIVVAPFSSSCNVDAMGPCSNSVELTSKTQQLLELSSLYDTPRLVPLSAAFSSDLLIEEAASFTRKKDASNEESPASDKDSSEKGATITGEGSNNEESTEQSNNPSLSTLKKNEALNSSDQDDSNTTLDKLHTEDTLDSGNAEDTATINKTSSTEEALNSSKTEDATIINKASSTEETLDSSKTEDATIINKASSTEEILDSSKTEDTEMTVESTSSNKKPSDDSYFDNAPSASKTDGSSDNLTQFISNNISDAEMKSIIAERVVKANLENSVPLANDGNKLAWGRFSQSQDGVVPRNDSLVYGDFLNASNGRLAEPVSYIANRDYKHKVALFRAESELSALDSTLGTVDFNMTASQANLYLNDGGLKAMEVQDGFLTIDFTRGQFDTGVTLQHELSSNINFRASGTINAMTGEFETQDSDGHLRGASTLEGDEASYIFYKDIDIGVIEGATMWHNK